MGGDFLQGSRQFLTQACMHACMHACYPEGMHARMHTHVCMHTTMVTRYNLRDSGFKGARFHGYLLYFCHKFAKFMSKYLARE